jgi:hypothetical protein
MHSVRTAVRSIATTAESASSFELPHDGVFMSRRASPSTSSRIDRRAWLRDPSIRPSRLSIKQNRKLIQAALFESRGRAGPVQRWKHKRSRHDVICGRIRTWSTGRFPSCTRSRIESSRQNHVDHKLHRLVVDFFGGMESVQRWKSAVIGSFFSPANNPLRQQDVSRSDTRRLPRSRRVHRRHLLVELIQATRHLSRSCTRRAKSVHCTKTIVCDRNLFRLRPLVT